MLKFGEVGVPLIEPEILDQRRPTELTVAAAIVAPFAAVKLVGWTTIVCPGKITEVSVALTNASRAALLRTLVFCESAFGSTKNDGPAPIVICTGSPMFSPVMRL